MKVTKVKVNENPALATRLGIRSIPTLDYFAGGKLPHQTVGAPGKQAILAQLEALVGAAGIAN